MVADFSLKVISWKISEPGSEIKALRAWQSRPETLIEGQLFSLHQTHRQAGYSMQFLAPSSGRKCNSKHMILQTVRVEKKDETCTFFVVNPHVYTLKTSAFTVCCVNLL